MFQSCATLSEIARTLNNLERLQFRLAGIDDFSLGGRRGDISRVSMDARPSVSTPLGDIIYPEHITIISREFR